MKLLFILLLAVCLTACASHPPKKIVIVPAVEPSHFVRSSTSVRIPEQIREYRFGRYVDPGDRLVMHEEHPVYRIERTNTWNLRPDGNGASTLRQEPAHAVAAPVNDAVLAEINKQKAATKAFTEQAAGLNQRLTELAQALKQTGQIAQQNVLLGQSISSLKTRLDELENRVRNAPAKASSKLSSTPEENW
jgi:hypothetical protein